MEFLNKNRDAADLAILGKICFDTLNTPICRKSPSNDFCGIYFEGRDRELDTIEDFAAVHSFRCFSNLEYPFLVFSPSSDSINKLSKKYSGVVHIQIPKVNSHDEYSQFMIKRIWDYIPKYFNRLLFFHPDGFLIKSGWENFILDNAIDYVGSAWCHAPSIDIDINKNNKWYNLGLPRINCGNGGFSYRNRVVCERVSAGYGNQSLRESGREDNRPPPEDLFYSHLINGFGLGRVASVEQCMKFSVDPITLDEYNKKTTFGFHYPKEKNEFQRHRDLFNSL